MPPGKERITIRLDADILEYFRGAAERTGGGSYQTLINNALRAFSATVSSRRIIGICAQNHTIARVSSDSCPS